MNHIVDKKLYFDILNENNILNDVLDEKLEKGINQISDFISANMEQNFIDIYNTIKYYNGSNSINKYVLSNINTYHKSMIIFGDITYYKYIKTTNLYGNINFLRYKFFEYYIGIKQDKKLTINYVFYFQFLDFLITKGRILLSTHNLLDTGYNLFGSFLQKIIKINHLTKYRVLYSYYSILNGQLTNNIGISRYFIDYPYSVRYFVYDLNKKIKKDNITDKNLIKTVIEQEIELSPKLSKKFKEGGNQNKELINDILNVFLDEELSENDKRKIGLLNDSGGEDDEGLAYLITEENEQEKEMKKLKLNFQHLFLKNKKCNNDINKRLSFCLYNVENIDPNKYLALNLKFGNINHDKLQGILSFNQTNQSIFLKGKILKKNLAKVNRKIINL